METYLTIGKGLHIKSPCCRNAGNGYESITQKGVQGLTSSKCRRWLRCQFESCVTSVHGQCVGRVRITWIGEGKDLTKTRGSHVRFFGLTKCERLWASDSISMEYLLSCSESHSEMTCNNLCCKSLCIILIYIVWCRRHFIIRVVVRCMYAYSSVHCRHHY
jgi:hypothetical protein